MGSLTNGASSTPLQTNGNQPAQNAKDAKPPNLGFESKSKKGGPSSESSPQRILQQKGKGSSVEQLKSQKFDPKQELASVDDEYEEDDYEDPTPRENTKR